MPVFQNAVIVQLSSLLAIEATSGLSGLMTIRTPKEAQDGINGSADQPARIGTRHARDLRVVYHPNGSSLPDEHASNYFRASYQTSHLLMVNAIGLNHQWTGACVRPSWRCMLVHRGWTYGVVSRRRWWWNTPGDYVGKRPGTTAAKPVACTMICQ